MGNTFCFHDFTNLFPVQKTLRFELKPIGRTVEHIENDLIIEKDEELAQNYKIAKRVLDRYHRIHINDALSNVSFKDNYSKLKRLKELLLKTKKSKEEIEEIKLIQKLLREKIVRYLEGREGNITRINEIKKRYQKIFKKDILTDGSLLAIAENDEEREALESFKKFYTYFKVYQENRKNIYSAEEESTAIAYRIINENLSIFIENIFRYEKIKDVIDSASIKALEKNMKNELGTYALNDFFTVEFFENVVSQDGIVRYNAIIGGKTTEKGEKIQGLNEIVNLYNQQNPEANLPILKPLYKQILSEDLTLSYSESKFEKDADLMLAIQQFWKNSSNLLDDVKRVASKIGKMREKDYENLYIEKKYITEISNCVYGEWNLLRNALIDFYEKNGKEIDDVEAFSWKEIIDAIKNYKLEEEECKDIDEYGFIEFFKNLTFKSTKNENESNNIIEIINKSFSKFQTLLKEDRGDRKDLHQEKDKVAIIKEFLDSLKNLQRFIRFLHLTVPIEGINFKFYNDINYIYENLLPLNKLYNMTRNYLTRKPYSTEKFKLNFYTPTLLDGWHQNKEKDNLGIILKRNGNFYLGIMNKKHTNLFKEIPKKVSKDFYEKMVYRFIPTPYRMLPKAFFTKKGIRIYNPPEEILRIYNNKEFKKGESFKKSSLHKLIDFYKEMIPKYGDWISFNFKFRKTSDYEDINEFYNDIEEKAYKIEFVKYDAQYIESLVEEGKLYLFQIYNKDFSPYSKGKPNLHTIYWRCVFADENLKNPIYKLNGEAEVYYRRKSLDYSEEIMKKGHHSNELKGKFKYPIIKDRRYAENKFLFHVPITMNYLSENVTNVNALALKYLKTTKEDVHIIGVDRGERNLLYISVIDDSGRIVEQRSLNVFTNENLNKEINYQEKLEQKEKNREKARENWDVIENIKELKEGYLSQVVHYIAELMVKYKAILVMEDLNVGFKRGRFKVERQVYQKFEKMMIDKLNYLIFKDNQPFEPGGSFKAYQLTAPFQSFKKLGKQTGMIFYVPARFTSRIDPTTGFYNFLKIDASTLQKAKNFFDKFDEIRYNPKEKYFEFTCTFKNFVNEPSKKQGTKIGSENIGFYNQIKDTKWTICSTNHERFKISKNKAGYVEYKSINVNEEIQNLLKSENIEYMHGNDIKSAITASNNAKFLRMLADNIKVLVALRYNNGKHGNEEKDYILSPVKNKFGKFFCTLDGDRQLPLDADANGAYNIALKGLIILNKIRENPLPERGKINLHISHYEWINFIMNFRGKFR